VLSSTRPRVQDEFRAAAVRDLMQFIRFPSVSAQPAHLPDIRRCAEWLAAHLSRLGLDHTSIVPTAGHPVVYADSLRAPGKPVLLIYGHYDVQPAEPLSGWQSPPFEPQIRGENLYGRGASDDKGQMFTHVKAIEWYRRNGGPLPVNVKCVFEGEEEIGSPNFMSFLRSNQSRLRADAAVVSDTRMLGPDRPAINESVRGSINFEVEIRGPRYDLHSGNFGGAVHNPLRALCSIVGSLHDVQARIRIPGFYDGVKDPTPAERSEMKRNGPSDEQIMKDAATRASFGESSYTLYERIGVRPALEITGIQGGYQGPGGKAIIPSSALVKINVRLVSGQDPNDVDRQFRAYVKRRMPVGLYCSIRSYGLATAAQIDRTSLALRAAIPAYEQGFGVPPILLRCGGTIPVVSMFQEVLHCPVVLMGFALPDDRAHGQNEKFHLPTFARGIQTSIHFLAELAAAS
jgi:acetylornithine deacetylase/succinyl-diaminopimelate desuccinylase-like protein